jgi:hypothetical protein
MLVVESGWVGTAKRAPVEQQILPVPATCLLPLPFVQSFSTEIMMKEETRRVRSTVDQTAEKVRRPVPTATSEKSFPRFTLFPGALFWPAQIS